MLYEDITATIGRTPLVRLRRLAAGMSSRVYVKLESFNPGGSIKDRIALSMIKDAEEKGLVGPGTTVIEATSGNTGIGLACVCASRGYDLVIVMPGNMTVERIKILELLGARVVLTKGPEGMTGANREAERLAGEIPGSFLPRQFENPANPRAHIEATAVEIWEDTGGEVGAVVCGVGTGGTVTGIASELKKHNPGLLAVAVEPAGSPVLSGGEAGPHHIPGIGAGFVPEVMCVEVVDEVMRVSDDDALRTMKRLAREEGILAGVSSGAAAWAALEVASRPRLEGGLVVAVLPDTAERYLSSLE